MKTQPAVPSSTRAGIDRNSDHSKLVSLLALATGAVAMPQTSEADIIYTDRTTNSVVVTSTSSFLIDNLPGTARLGFQGGHKSTTISSARWVLAGQAAGYVRIRTGATNNSFVVHVPQGQTWNQIPGIASRSGLVGYGNYFFATPNSYNDMYLAFMFRDSTQGNAVRYGWLQLSLFNPGSGLGPDVTISAWAYDTTGAQLATGQIPEPNSMALLALGALALGAKGVRAWRRNRPPVGPS